MYKHLGSRTVYRQSYDVADCYEKLAGADEACADILYQAGQYNQGAYFLLQAMEKYVKSRICRRIDVLNPYYADVLRQTGHSLEESVDLLVKIEARGDAAMEEHISRQIKEGVLQNIYMPRLYNAVRYPFYRSHHYSLLTLEKQDYDDIKQMFSLLKIFIRQLEVR